MIGRRSGNAAHPADAMNVDGSAGVAVRASVAISAPFLFQSGIMMLLSGLGLGLLAACLIIVPVRLSRAAR